jgi:hypothetical protein
MKLLYIIIFVQINLYSQVKQLTDFKELFDALKNGGSVSAVIHYSSCRLVIDSVEAESPDAIGGMDITPFEYFSAGLFKNNPAYIASSQTVLIYIKKYGYVYNYVKLKIIEDNTVEVTARYLSVNDYKILMDETFYCSINDGIKGGVYLYLK